MAARLFVLAIESGLASEITSGCGSMPVSGRLRYVIGKARPFKPAITTRHLPSRTSNISELN